MAEDDIRAQLLAAYEGEYRDHLEALRAMLGGGGAFDAEEAYRRAHSLKGAARAVDLGQVETLAHRLESLLQAVWEGGQTWRPAMARAVARALDAVEDVSAAALSGAPEPDAGAAAADLDAELLATGLPPGPVVAAPATVAQARAAETVRVETEAMDRLLHTTAALLGEAARRRRLTADIRRTGPADAARALDEADWRFEHLAALLREDVERLRMVPAEGAFAGLTRAAREAAAALGRRIRVEAAGLETRADREVLQALREPLLHALRNAVVHGIEPPEDRLALGKDPEGLVRLVVAASGGMLTVRVEDDGRGLDLAALERQGRKRGLLPAEGGAPPEALRALAFASGVSTAAEVDTLAGRGMGMGIIRQAAARLQGTARLEERAEGGTALVVAVPVTVVAQRLVMVEAAGETFALPAAAVLRLAPVPRTGVVMVEGRPEAPVDGVPTPLAELAALLPLSGGPPVGDTLCTAVVTADGHRLGVVVDAFLDVRELAVTPMEAPFAEDPVLVGTVSGDGRVVPVLSPQGLLARAGSAGLGLSPPPKPARAPSVLVVDDSITTRTLEKSILETHGYRVSIAVDGQQALELLARERADVVVSDVEMPRMDGFALLETLRRDPVLGAIPVVLVTSRESEEDRRRGLDLGADAYIGKGRFDQDLLLDTVARLV